jgi:hypothetical protein
VWAVVVGGLVGASLIVGCGGAAKRSATTAHAGLSRPSAASTTTSAAAAVPRASDPATICTAKALAAIGRFFAVAPGSIATHAATADSDFPECQFTVHRSGGRVVRVTVEVDTEPQAYAVLDRTIVEAAQIFGPQRYSAAPVNVPRLGILASWFPQEQHLETTDAVRVIIATIAWPEARTARKIALATAAARPYLGRNQLQLARGPVSGVVTGTLTASGSATSTQP